MTYDDNNDLFKFSEKSFTKTVCPYEIPINVNQTKLFKFSYDKSSSDSEVEARNFFVDDEFCPIQNFTFTKENCNSKVDPTSKVTFDNETNIMTFLRNVASGW